MEKYVCEALFLMGESEYGLERLKKRFIQLLAKFGIKISDMDKNDRDDDLYDEFKKFSKK